MRKFQKLKIGAKVRIRSTLSKMETKRADVECGDSGQWLCHVR